MVLVKMYRHPPVNNVNVFGKFSCHQLVRSNKDTVAPFSCSLRSLVWNYFQCMHGYFVEHPVHVPVHRLGSWITEATIKVGPTYGMSMSSCVVTWKANTTTTLGEGFPHRYGYSDSSIPSE